MGIGTVLTFDTNMPRHQDEEPEDWHVAPELDEASFDVRDGFSDFRCAVKKIPFGFEISVPKSRRPTVRKVMQGSPADEAGVKVGDTLIEVAGLPVGASSWFKAFQQAVPPFGLHFRRPTSEAKVADGGAASVNVSSN